jgi:hypothetical protein
MKSHTKDAPRIKVIGGKAQPAISNPALPARIAVIIAAIGYKDHPKINPGQNLVVNAAAKKAVASMMNTLRFFTEDDSRTSIIIAAHTNKRIPTAPVTMKTMLRRGNSRPILLR